MLQMRTMFAGWAVVLALAAVANADYVAVDYTGASITGIWNTTAGGNATVATVGVDAGMYPSGENPGCVLDSDTSSKYLAFGDKTLAGGGLNTGFYVTLASAAQVTAIQFATANDNAVRDPLTITVEGSNATGSDLLTGTNWTALYSGVSGLAALGDGGRQQYGVIEGFSNTTAYTSYRVLVVSKRGELDSTQYSEVELFTGSPIPEPSTTILGLTGTAGLLAYAWRKRR